MIQRICSLLRVKVPAQDIGYLVASGVAIPVDGTAGYAPACIFQVTVAGAEGVFVNEGTISSCDFNAI